MRISIPAILTALFVCLVIPNVSYATTSGLEIESTLDTILLALRGRVAYFIGVGSIVIAAAGWAASEGNSMARSGFKIATALAIMFNAVTIAAKLYKATEGMNF